MDRFLQLDAEALGQIRKTSEDPPRVSIYDVIRMVTGQAPKDTTHTWNNLKVNHPAVARDCNEYFQFPGAGQRLTPVATTANVAEISAIYLAQCAQQTAACSLSERAVTHNKTTTFTSCGIPSVRTV